jgi:Zn-finger in ubiquitin-hydrolases and other protein
MKSEREGINALAKPSGTGCVECLATGGWWLHLRRCAECGHIGCCDTSPSQHASKHNAATGHPIITSFERGERCFTIIVPAISLPVRIFPPLTRIR